MKERKYEIIQLLLLTTTVFYLHTTYAKDWPQWRGPNRDGVATNIDVPEN